MAVKAKKPEGYRARALPAVVKAMKRSKRPWSRAEIDEKVKVTGLGKRSISGMVNDAQFAGREIDGYRFTRPERGATGSRRSSRADRQSLAPGRKAGRLPMSRKAP